MKEISDEATRKSAWIAGAVLFGVAAVIELVRLVKHDVPGPGYGRAGVWLSAIALALWVGSAYLMARRSAQHELIPILGAFALFTYGLLGTTAGAIFGVVYIVFGIVMTIIQRLAFGGKLDLGWQGPPPAPRAPGPPEVL